MFTIRHQHEHTYDRSYDDSDLSEVKAGIKELRGLIHQKMELLMIDTSRILAEVARERTELASWKALSAAKDKVIADQAEALRKAIADSDPVAMAQVQADLDKAAGDLKNDNDEAEAAVAAVPAA